jgi:hypothetical protein
LTPIEEELEEIGTSGNFENYLQFLENYSGTSSRKYYICM